VTQVRERSTFLKVGQSLILRRRLQTEKQLKHNMIHSLMPPKVAEQVLRAREGERSSDDRTGGGGGAVEAGLSSTTDMFRRFHMLQMGNVSILFADIVGFTKMSSNKSAKHLVMLLNDLFGRFDDLCLRHGCEKISTLGDCYYCVSGCPEPRDDHARCCVEMGLAMCVAIQEFDRVHSEEVNMRVGVHTGTVLCGIVGTRRFKFDVWSHDVTLANMMESEGRPGRVHVSDDTHRFIKELYEVEPGDEVEGESVGTALRGGFMDGARPLPLSSLLFTGCILKAAENFAQNALFLHEIKKITDGAQPLLRTSPDTLSPLCSEILDPPLTSLCHRR